MVEEYCILKVDGKHRNNSEMEIWRKERTTCWQKASHFLQKKRISLLVSVITTKQTASL